MPRRLIAITGLAATALLGFGPAAFAEPPAVATAKVENFTLVDQAGRQPRTRTSQSMLQQS